MLFATIMSWAPFAIGVVLVTAVLLKRSRRYYRGNSRRRSSVRQTKAPVVKPKNDRPLADAPREILGWQVEMHETARDLKAELDSKLVALGILVRDAERESQRLETAITRASRLGVTAAVDPLDQIESYETAALAEAPKPAGIAHQDQIYKLADQGYGVTTIADELGSPLGDVELALSLRR